MPWRLMRFALSPEHPEGRMFQAHAELKASYDVVIIGAGGHGLAAAYYLARDHGITNVCVLEKGYIGGGNTGRNTTIIRSNYITPEGVRFYDASVKLWEDLSEDFDLNLFYSKRGHYTLAHTDSALRTMRWRAEVNKHYGVESELVGPEFIQRELPMMDMSCGGHAPVLGALYHAPGAIARHDAVAWGYGRGADRRGVEIHQKTEVTGISVISGKVHGVQTARGFIHTEKVLCAVAGSTPRLLHMVDLQSPIYIHPLQAMVSEPTKPWLNPIIVSGSLHVYISQSARGELVLGASLDPYELHSTRSTLDFTEGLSAHILELFPFLSHVKIVRQWAGIADMTPDFAPIMGKTPVEGFYLDAGWGTWGFKATPVAGKTMAHTVASDSIHPLITEFSLDRFRSYALTGEKGAASVGH
ncbi:FAD-dependent oxidoreductase [Acidithiobacillus ferriphilus]|uniref:FAD-dependent oxidoreductase n=1 Tax=Acidithiobacillus ferriphilus TaxID=1689834 RepID=UPI001C0641A4|nr:FAD-dependent oxidoreductase [Acidithiobacillus ferriphilus]MBU2784253.1 FAD-dependent oxidoreductase [Acidithiobacillus ferriphilus]UEP58615.1 FAD-dependent oxidoreductase [Acidithiobacillus ferriphilus]